VWTVKDHAWTTLSIHNSTSSAARSRPYGMVAEKWKPRDGVVVLFGLPDPAAATDRRASSARRRARPAAERERRKGGLEHSAGGRREGAWRRGGAEGSASCPGRKRKKKRRESAAGERFVTATRGERRRRSRNCMGTPGQRRIVLAGSSSRADGDLEEVHSLSRGLNSQGPTTSQPKRTVGLFGNGFQLGTACRPAGPVRTTVSANPTNTCTYLSSCDVPTKCVSSWD
jgi:hypothetical protein